jgi:hypothetical protein
MGLALLCAVVTCSNVGYAAGVKSYEEVAMGQAMAQEVQKKFTIFPKESERLARIGRRLLRAGPWPKEFAHSYSFVVAQDPNHPDTLNAFCAPGGFVCFYKKLYDELDKQHGEAAIAAVMAHEIEHAARHHVARMKSKRKVMGDILSALSIGGASDLVLGLGSLFADFQSLQYSREHENESDEWGIARLWRAGYPASAMAQTFEYLGSQSGGKPPKWLSSHPTDRERIGRARQRAQYLAQRNPMDTLNEARIIHRDGKAYVTAGWVDGITSDTKIVSDSSSGRAFSVDRKSIRFSETQVRAKTSELPEGTTVRFDPPLRGYHDEPAAVGTVLAVDSSSNTITVDLGQGHRVTLGLTYEVVKWFEAESEVVIKDLFGRKKKHISKVRVPRLAATARIKEVRERECLMELTDFRPKPSATEEFAIKGFTRQLRFDPAQAAKEPGEKFSIADILVGDEAWRSDWVVVNQQSKKE